MDDRRFDTRRVSVVVLRHDNTLRVIITGDISSLPRVGQVVYRLDVTAVKSIPYSTIVGKLKELPHTAINNHGITGFPVSELDNIKSTLLIICRGISVGDAIQIIEHDKPVLELLEKNGKLASL